MNEFDVQPCGYKCFDCPYDDCIMPTSQPAKKTNRPVPAEIVLNTYPAPDWKNHPIYGRAST